MKLSSRFMIAVCTLLFLTCYGCAGRPDEQLQAAQDAMNQARELNAERYAPGDWTSAMEAWDEAQAQLEKNQYGSAGPSFLRARTRFLKALEIAKAQRDAVQREIESLQAGIGSHYANLKSGLASAAIAGSVKRSIESAYPEIDRQIAELEAMTEKGELIEARLLAQSILQRIYENEKKLLGTRPPD